MRIRSDPGGVKNATTESSACTDSADPKVAYISLDRPVRGSLAQATDYADVAVGANIAASYGLTGKGVGVAIMDSGISAHPDLASRVVYRESFIGGTNNR